MYRPLKRSVTNAACIGVAVVVLARLCASAAEPVTISVHEGQRKTFGGFGVSANEDAGNYYKSWPEGVRKYLAKLFWADADFRLLRLWVSNDQGDYVQEAETRAAQYKVYVDEALAEQPELVVLLGTTGSGTSDRSYAQHYANLIRELKDVHGIEVHVTGIANEPNVRAWSGGQVAQQIVYFREELDARGLNNVKIIAPEVSNVDGGGMGYVSAIKENGAAMAVLDGMATHSYSVGMTKAMMDLIGPNIDHWNTESSTPDTETPTRILSDLNLGINYWIFFLGYADYDPDNGQWVRRLAQYNPADNDTMIFPRFYSMAELSRHFRTGTVMRWSTTSLSGDINTYMQMNLLLGPMPPLASASGLRPDGSWALAVANQSGFPAWHQTPAPSTTYDVTFDVEELRDSSSLTFALRRFDMERGELKNEGEMEMSNGLITVADVPPGELVMLRSEASVGARRQSVSTAHNSGRPMSIEAVRGHTVQVTLAETAGEGSRVNLTICDGRGAKVATVERPARVGRAKITWQGTNSQGRPVPPGVYLLAVQQGSARLSARVVLR